MQQLEVGCPAHAGIDPALPEPQRSPIRLPRTRGDRPYCQNTPATDVRLPRTRGDRPRIGSSVFRTEAAAPHTWG